MPLDSRQQATLERATELALSYLESLDAAPVCATTPLAELRRRFSRPLPDEGVDPVTVIDELARDAAGGLLGSAGGRFYGWVIGAGLPSALAADWLTATWDQNAGLYACGPAAAVVEEVCGAWLKDVLGLPASASFALVTGCQMAHVTCLAAARHAVLARAGWDVNRDGLAGAPSLRILTSSEVHGTTTRAAKLLGIGTANIIGAAERLGVAAHARRSCATPWHGSPGGPRSWCSRRATSTAAPSIPFPSSSPWPTRPARGCTSMAPWASGATRCRSSATCSRGAEQADSWATDGHKWLNVPYDCGYAFVAHPEHHRAAMEHRASYLVHADDARDQLDWTPDHSRRARGFATYAALRELGRTGLARPHRALLPSCPRHRHPHRRPAECPRHLRPADQPGAGALLRRTARGDRGGPR